jgi:regulator of protease activity HflC (stomatin/prohibitin superfamily)
VEILATVVEAIHPPAGAANAYHGVQAAQIGAQALISRERGAAAEASNQALLQASLARDQASASAREINATAQAADLKFSAEQKAYASAGQAFVLEQYLSQLSRAEQGQTVGTRPPLRRQQQCADHRPAYVHAAG